MPLRSWRQRQGRRPPPQPRSLATTQPSPLLPRCVIQPHSTFTQYTLKPPSHRLQVHVFDFDNLVDSHSLAMFLQSVAPRHLVLVAAPPTDREALAARCMAAFARGGVDVAVHAPNAGDVLDCSAPTLSQPLLLHESLTLGLRRQGPRCVTWVSGTAEGEVAPLRLVGTGRGGEGGLFIGEAKLSSAKAAMDRSGIAAEFARGGALVCAGGVKVLSTAGGEGVTGGELLLEGPLSSDFFAVRQAIYSMYHIC